MAADLEHDQQAERIEHARRAKAEADARFEETVRSNWNFVKQLRADHGAPFVQKLLRDMRAK